jgi:outer membrane protein assembly factor BamD (BamD/ComL family)
VIFATGCIASFQQTAAPDSEECDHLELVRDFIGKGDFEGALKASQRLLSRSPKSPPGDQALLDLGLINAHYANPKKDYKKALGYFLRVEREFPRSPLVEEARIWVSVLRAFEKAKQVDIEIEERKKEMGK